MRADQDQTVRIELRLPVILKGQLSEFAKAQGVSLNEWLWRAAVHSALLQQLEMMENKDAE